MWPIPNMRKKSPTLLSYTKRTFTIYIIITMILLTVAGLNSSPSSVAYMRRWNGSALVQVMACRLDDTEPLSEPMVIYYQLEFKEHISMNVYFKFKYFHSRKCVWTCHLRNSGHFVKDEKINIQQALTFSRSQSNLLQWNSNRIFMCPVETSMKVICVSD